MKVGIFPRNKIDGELIKDTIEPHFQNVVVTIIDHTFLDSLLEENFFDVVFVAQDFLEDIGNGTQLARLFADEYPNTVRITYANGAELRKSHARLASEIDNQLLSLNAPEVKQFRDMFELASKYLTNKENLTDSEGFGEIGLG